MTRDTPGWPVAESAGSGWPMPSSLIPNFALYGEPPCAIAERFLHVEPLDDRSRPNGWTIRPHAHAHLCQIFHIVTGGGVMHAEERQFVLNAPCLLLVPAKVVHGFSYRPDTAGSVLTVADAYFGELFRREPDLALSMGGPACLAVEDDEGIAACLGRLQEELIGTRVGRSAAVEASLLAILVGVLRLIQREPEATRPVRGPHAVLVSRFRDLIEQRYRSHVEIEALAQDLSVTSSRLRQACVKITGAGPHQLMRERLVVEAKRLLIYSHMTIAEIGFFLGFEDPAYFSRFFSKATGESLRAFRDSHETPLKSPSEGRLRPSELPSPKCTVKT